VSVLLRAARSWVVLAFAALLAGPLAVGAPLKQRLPPDQELIDHFRANRQGFVRLVEEYKLAGGAIAGTGRQRPEVARQLDELGLERMVRVYELWFPDPYSAASGERAAAPGAARLFEFHAIKFEYRESLEVPGPRGVIYWKQYVYFPAAPRIKDGRALRAAPLTEQVSGYRVLNSLDTPPSDWQRSECLLRTIEPQWFLRLCRS
jgi:hypothetical protein